MLFWRFVDLFLPFQFSGVGETNASHTHHLIAAAPYESRLLTADANTYIAGTERTRDSGKVCGYTGFLPGRPDVSMAKPFASAASEATDRISKLRQSARSQRYPAPRPLIARQLSKKELDSSLERHLPTKPQPISLAAITPPTSLAALDFETIKPHAVVDKNTRIIPRYAGHVPNERRLFGQTYGDATEYARTLFERDSERRMSHIDP